MSDSVFRTANTPASTDSAPAEKPTVDTRTAAETHVDTLLVTYQDDQGKPYVAQYFELDGVWDKDSSLKNELNTVEGFLRQEVTKGKLENNTKSAKRYLNELEKKAQTNQYESTTKRLSKLLAYIEFRKVIDE